MEKIGAGVIGLGTMGPTHAKWYALMPEVELKAVCDTVESRAKRVAAEYNVDWYVDYRELLERRDIDAVDIVIPHYLHAQVAVEAAEAGKHVAVEKPLCTSLKDADRMIRAVEKAGVLDLYCENLCFAPSCNRAKEVIDRGGVGRVYMIRAREAGGLDMASETHRREVEESWYYQHEKAGGGCMISSGIHAAGYIRYLLDKEPAVRVYAELSSEIMPEGKERIEDVGVALVRYRGGQIGVIESSFCASGGYDDRAEIYGTKGSIFVDIYRRNQITVHSLTGYDMAGHSMFLGEAEGADRGWAFLMPDEEWDLGYFHELRHFVECIRKGERPKFNFEDGRSVLEVILAAYRSKETGKPVSTPLRTR